MQVHLARTQLNLLRIKKVCNVGGGCVAFDTSSHCQHMRHRKVDQNLQQKGASALALEEEAQLIATLGLKFKGP